MTSSGKTYRRYTNLAAAIHMLQTKQITLLSPEKWDDGNDRHFMEIYQAKRNLKTLVAICLAKDADTYGHWRVFSPNADGVCVVLKKDPLIEAFNGISGVRHGEVDYKEIALLQTQPPAVYDLPFLKRWPYRPEGEYRVIYESRAEESVAKSFSIPEGCIHQVVLSPWMPEPLVESVKTTLKSIRGCEGISMYQSTLIKNQLWTSLTDKAIDDGR
ncbi:DUF2971 domain-containing protein [Rhizobium leguminosarum]|uniref:hypothetical protein n=1 Tax=Rhizobium leguminosarum TaxID=384 RepID=UPI001C938CAE|nr:hypothetical protein [Rhizobium leguminosarum]MBY5475736.1 DUF2971 domain-containing protein [Rhizobium leguminosarum]